MEAMLACFACFALAQRGKRPCACLMETLGSDAAGMFRMFRFGPTWEEALCMFDGNFVEAMPACFASFALAQRGKGPCACLIKMFWKRFWHVSHVSLWPNVGRGLVHV